MHTRFILLNEPLPLRMDRQFDCRAQRFTKTISFRTAYEGENADANIRSGVPMARALERTPKSGKTN
jgi:hypothetical protein